MAISQRDIILAQAIPDEQKDSMLADLVAKGLQANPKALTNFVESQASQDLGNITIDKTFPSQSTQQNIPIVQQNRLEQAILQNNRMKDVGNGLANFAQSFGYGAIGKPIDVGTEKAGWQTYLGGAIGSQFGKAALDKILWGQPTTKAPDVKPTFYNTPEQQFNQKNAMDVYRQKEGIKNDQQFSLVKYSSTIPSGGFKSQAENDAWFDSLPAEAQGAVDSVANYEASLKDLTGLRKGSQDRLALNALVKARNPEFDMKKYPMRQKFISDWNSSIGLNSRGPADLASQHLPYLGQSLQDLKNGQLQIANAGKNLAAKQAGQEQVQRASTFALAYSTELVKMLRGSNMMNESEQKDWQERLSQNMSPEQISTTVDSLGKIMIPRFNIMMNNFKTAMGRYPTPDEAGFSPEAIASLRKIAPEEFDKSSLGKIYGVEKKPTAEMTLEEKYQKYLKIKGGK